MDELTLKFIFKHSEVTFQNDFFFFSHSISLHEFRSYLQSFYTCFIRQCTRAGPEERLRTPCSHRKHEQHLAVAGSFPSGHTGAGATRGDEVSSCLCLSTHMKCFAQVRLKASLPRDPRCQAAPARGAHRRARPGTRTAQPGSYKGP